VARNRKRAKERRARQPQPVPGNRLDREDGAPPPLEHAAPDAELAEAQMALGRPDLADAVPSDADDELVANGVQPDAGDELEADDELELEAEAEAAASGGAGNGAAVSDGTPPASDGGEVAVPSSTTAAERQTPGRRLINFLRGSWRELQRVQWPDRRQVMQATGVVIGFVIVAGVFLGVADTLAGHLMNFILTGKW